MEGEAKAARFRIPLETELRGICRNSVNRWVSVKLRSRRSCSATPWLWLGESSLLRPGNGTGHVWWLKSYLGPRAGLPEGVPTDREHDSAYACRLPLIGVEMESIQYHHTVVVAWIDPDNPEDFRVPLPGYDPRTHPEAVLCEDPDCLKMPTEEGGGPHIIVPEGFYCPPFHDDLYRAVRGQRVEITFFPGVDNG